MSEPLDKEQIAWIRRAVACHFYSPEEARAFGVEPDRKEYVRPPEEDPVAEVSQEEEKPKKKTKKKAKKKQARNS